MPDSFMLAVNDAVSVELEKKEKVIRMKKKFLTAIAATFILGVTAVGASMAVSTVSHSSPADEFTSAAEIGKKSEEIGFDYKYAEGFTNGYEFKRGVVGGGSDLDENGVKLNEFKFLSLEYEGDEGEVHLSIDKYRGEDELEEGKFKTSTKIYKWCPADYEMTEQDKEDMESGKYEFSYGISGDEVVTEEINSVLWLEDGVSYHLFQYGNSGSLTLDELVKMAEEIKTAE